MVHIALSNEISHSQHKTPQSLTDQLKHRRQSQHPQRVAQRPPIRRVPRPPARPTPRVQVVAPPDLKSDWVGIDKRDFPRDPRTGNADPDWMGMLIDNSNIRFTGAYLQGDPLPHTIAAAITRVEEYRPETIHNLPGRNPLDHNRLWIPNVRNLVEQGWGIWFLYFGYSVADNRPPISVRTGSQNQQLAQHRQLGELHGRHLKMIMEQQLGIWPGAVVFVDNEDVEATDLTAEMEGYYLGLFDEMSRPDTTTLRAYRPGLYSRGLIPTRLLARRPDLFLWDVQLSHPTSPTVCRPNTPPPPNTTAAAPFSSNDDPISIDPANTPIRAYPLTTTRQHLSFVIWPLGRQFRFYGCDMPKHPSVVVNRLQRLGQQWRAINVWDYDVSFVRNPAFPVASPRIVSIQSGTQIVLLRGNFQSRSATVPSPSMTVREINPVPSTISLENVLVQPDSPIVLFRLGRDEITALTILTTNSIGEAVRSPEGVWSPIREIAGTVPPLRRIWAAAAVSPNLADSYLFCVGEDHKLYVKIRKSGERWKDYREVARNVPRLHPFSNIAVSARYSSTNRTIIDVLFIDQDGILTVTTIQIIIEELALVSTIKLQQAPTLLFGSALALVTPVQLGHVLAFAIDNTLHMVMCYYDGQRWTTVNPIGRQNERVGPHARIATLAVSGNEVDVVTLTDVGDTALYILRWNGRTWVSDPRVVFPQPPPSGPTPAAPPPAAILAPAPGCRINPYGDIAVSRSPNSTVSTIYCAGLLNGSNNILTRELNPVNPNVGTWQFFL